MTKIIQRKNAGSPVLSFGNLVDHFFTNALNGFWNDDFPSIDSIKYGSVPVNIRESEQEYEIEVVAPGLRKEDFRVEVTNDRLSICFDHAQESSEENKDEGWIRKEYRKQAFCRSFALADTMDTSNISANYKDGILTLRVPRKEKGSNLMKTIQVN